MRIFGGAPGKLSRNPPEIAKIFSKDHKQSVEKVNFAREAGF